ncbi:threonylcarbamoyl-AMP synthase [Candidatus Woesearchaeota archaeon]|nr:threonylcarbamoyl-AMP synthase [Candidatus Woesearchaeota archaeon]
MRTKMMRVNAKKPSEQTIEAAAQLIREGRLVAFPTETVYGLGANAFDAKAVRKVFRAKRRPADDPLIVHVASVEMLEHVVARLSKRAKTLMRKFWPGPLTIILPKGSRIPKTVTAGLPNVAVRMPAHPVALALIEKAGVPIAAPSANLFGMPSPTTAHHVLHDLHGRIPLILDAGQTKMGIESTVLSLIGKPTVLRPGGVPFERLRKSIPNVRMHGFVGGTHSLAPGMLARHYVPRTRLVLVLPPNASAKIDNLLHAFRHKRVGILCLTQHAHQYHRSDIIVKRLGRSAREAAHNLFAALRLLDSKGLDVIIAEGPSQAGLGLAVMNRLRKAASRTL